MELSQNLHDLLSLRAELVLTAVILLLLTIELFSKGNKTLLSAVSLTGVGLVLVLLFGESSTTQKLFTASNGVPLMIIEPLGTFAKIIAAISALFTILFMGINREDATMSKREGEFVVLLLCTVLGVFFLSSSYDLILLYTGFELLSISSYALAGYYKRSIQSSEASLKYLVYGAASSAIMIYGISILYGLTGTTNIFIIQALLGTGAYSGALLIMAVVLILAGIAFKISAFPFHFWTPDVYEGAPTHFTAYLSVASKIGGFILLLRLILDLFFRKGFNSDILQPVSSLPWDDILIFISIGSMTIGNLVALWQKNIKRLLAYSSIAHAGYLLAGIAALNSTGMVAVLVYFAFYLLMNMGAFLVVILIKNEIKSEMLEDYNGIGSKMPLYAIALSIFLVSLTGLPPTAGFIGKFYILMALINADMVLLAFFLFLNSVISLYYYVRVMKHLFISKPEKDYSEAKQSVYGGVLTLVLAVPTLIFGIFFTPILKFAEAALKFYLP